MTKRLFLTKIKLGTKTRLLQLFFALVVLSSLPFAPWIWWVVALLAYVVCETLGGNIGLHRYFGHRSFKTTPFRENILLFFSHYIGVGSVISWVGQHRFHHDYSDTEKDIHSPYIQGPFKIIFGLWNLNIPLRYARESLKNPKLRRWHEHYFAFHLAIILFWMTLDLLFNTYFLLALYAAPNLLCLLSGYVLAILAHYHGYRSYETADRSTNSWIVNIYTLGEGWHNNHHANPQSYQQGEKPGEWDFPAWCIRTFFITSAARQFRVRPLFVLQMIAHLSIIPMILYAQPQHYVAAFVVYFFTGCVGMSMTYHRLLSHRSWRPPPGFEFFGTLCGTLGLTGSSLGWTAVHRVHHTEVDSTDDPHSPHFKGFLWTQFFSMNYVPALSDVKDLIRKPYHRFFHRHYLGVQITYVLLLGFLIGPFAIVYAYLFPAAILWNTGSLVNSAGHMWGYKNFPVKDQSRNNPLLAALTWGEGWHNNHHRYQKKSYFGHRWFELDIAGILIQCLKYRKNPRSTP
jgi:stearoyl-CoA desaturase (delta-9 desaturase)